MHFQFIQQALRIERVNSTLQENRILKNQDKNVAYAGSQRINQGHLPPPALKQGDARRIGPFLIHT